MNLEIWGVDLPFVCNIFALSAAKKNTKWKIATRLENPGVLVHPL